MAIVVLVVVCKILSFNGLYGQDAHEYLRQCRVLYDRMHCLPTSALQLGDVEFAGGYPLVGALLHWLIPDAILAMQMVTWLSTGLAVWFFYRNLCLLSPGAHAKSRAVFTALGLMLAPYFVRAGMTSMSDMPALACTLGAFWLGLRVVYKGRGADAVGAAVLMAFAVITRYGLAALLAPLAGAMLLMLWRRRNWAAIFLMAGAGLLALTPHFWVKDGVEWQFLHHSMGGKWSVEHFFQRSFTNENGTVHYLVPNILYLLFPLAHPGFCLLLPGLLLLSKKTDVVLQSKKVLIASLLCYLLLLGGLPHQNLRFLLPAYALLLLLFFPAWDRMFAYGFYFFKRLTWSILALLLLVQVVAGIKIIAPIPARNRLEQDMATRVRSFLPSGAVVYSFDVDVALRSYLPEMDWRNMWMYRYDYFAPGSYVLFNEPLLRPQWEGHNPIVNWNHIKETRRLQLVRELPGGWNLYLMNELSDE